MVQRVEAWGNTLEFPDDMSDEDMASAIRSNEANLNPNASTFTKATSAVSSRIDAGLSMLTPKRSIADQAQSQPSLAPNAERIQRNNAIGLRAFTSAEPVPVEGGFINSAGRTIGQNIKGAGQVAADYLGADRNNAVKRYGQAVIDANPTAVNSLSDIADNPGTAVSEATGNAAPSMAGMIGARAVGQGITALSPLAGPAAPLVAAAGQVVSWLGPAAIASLPSYGGIRDKQILNDPKNEKDAKSIAIATMGAAAVGAIEQAFGPQQWALAAMTKQGRAALAEKFAATTLAGSIGKGVVKGAAIEGSEELAQNPIEQLAAGDNPTTPENLKDTAFGGVMGAIGGGVLGGGSGMILGKRATEQSDGVLKYTAERGGEKAKAIAQAELDRRAKQGVDPAIANAPETTPEAVQRIIATGKDKARDISGDSAKSTDAIQSAIFDETQDAPDTPNVITARDEKGNVIQDLPTEGNHSLLPTAKDMAGPNGTVEVRPLHDAMAERGNNSAQVVLPDNTHLPAQWDVVDADSVSASLKQGVNQPRDRTRAASDVQVQGIANNPDYHRLSDSPVMDVGAPTLGHDGAIVGGNGRFEGISRAYDQGTAGNYLANLKANAAAKGIDPAKIDGMKKPVLVRRITQPFDARTLAVASNSGTSLQYSGMELAKIDAERMKGLENLDVTDSGDIALTGSNLQGVRHALGDYSAAELGALTDKEGMLSQEGIRRIRNAMLHRAYGSNPTLERLVESTDNDLRNISGALIKAAGSAAKVRADIQAGTLPAELDISANLVAAVETLSKIRTQGMSVDEHLAQIGMFGDEMTDDEKQILRVLEANIRSQKKTAEFIKSYYDSVSRIDQSTGDIFGASIPTKQELLSNAKKRITEKQPVYKDLFARPTRAADTESSKQPANNGGVDGSSEKNKQVNPPVSPKAEAAPQAASGNRLDHGELNVKGRTDNINRELDKYKKEQESLAKTKSKSSAQQTKEQKILAKSLLERYGQEIVEKHKEKLGEKEIKGTLDQWSKWEPHKLISFVDKFLQEQAASAPVTKSTELPGTRPLVESLIKRRAAAKQVGKERSINSAIARAKEVMEGNRTDTALESKWFRIQAAGMRKADPATANILQNISDTIKPSKVVEHKTESVIDKPVSASPVSNKPSTVGLSVQDIKNHIAPLQKAGTKKIKVAATEADLPKNIQDAIKSAGAAGVRGVYYPKTDEVWLVADKLNNADEAIMVALHEARHRGLRNTFGEGIAPIMRQIYGTNKNVRNAADAMMKSVKGMSKEEAVEEVLADMAISKSAHTVNGWKRLVQFIQKWLIDHGISLKFTDAMVESLVAGAEKVGTSDNKVGVFDDQQADGNPMFKRVFHGTPHLYAPEPGFPHGRPRLDKIGTGEGENSYGWGFYSADSMGTANHYREMLGLLRADTATTLVKHFPNRHFTTSERAEVYKAAIGDDPITSVARRLGYRKESLRTIDENTLTDSIKELREAAKGNIYSLDIPDSVLPHLLDWDKPMNQQSPEIKKSLIEAGRPEAINKMSGEKWYKALGDEETLRSDKAASKYLSSIGIVGNQYLDSGSRAGGEGTHNYVIWDQPTLNKVALLERNGEKLDAIRDAETRFSRTPQTGQNASWNSPEPSKMDDLIYKLQNKHIDLKRAIQSIQTTGAQLADQWDTYLQEELFHGRAAKRTQDFVNRELKPIIMGMKLRGQTIDELDKYLHARHAEEANKLIASRDPNMPDGGSGMTTKDAKDYLANLPADKRKALENTAKQVDAVIAKTRNTYLSYGLIDQDTADSWEHMFKHYVPLMREDNDGGMGIGQGFSIKGKEAKHRTGSKRKVVDILANIALQRERAIVRGEKNRVAVSLAGLAKLNPNPEFWTFDKAPTERMLVPKKNTYEVHYHGSKVMEFTSPVEAKKFIDFQGDPAYTMNKVEIPEHVENRADPMFKNRDNVVVAKIKDSKGNVIERAVVFNEHDERAMRMAAAMKNLDATQLEGLFGVSASITRYFAAINTQYNPVFGVVNLTRDLQASLLNLSSTQIAGHKAQVLKNILPAIGAIYSSTRGERQGKQSNTPMGTLWDEMQNEGGMTGYRDLFKTSEDRANAIKNELDPTAWMNNGLGKIFTAGGTLKVPLAVAQKKARWIFDWLSDYNQTLEGAMRLSVYKTTIDNGVSKPQAASIAKNISVNFNRKGQSGQQAGALYAFFNAAMQGTARMSETMTTMEKGDPKTLRFNKAGKTIIAGGISIGVIQALALSAAGFDDDEPPEFVRERSLIIPIGDKKYISIPMPLGFHAIPNIGRLSTEFALGGFKKPTDYTAKLFMVFAEAFNPIGSSSTLTQTLSPTVTDPLVALAENKDWTGKPIAKEDFSKLSPTPGFSRNKDTASDPSKWIAEAINTISGGNKYVPGVASPTADQIDYLFGQITGGVGREVNKGQQSIKAATTGEDLPPHKIPLVGRFYGDSSGQTSQGNAFYSNLKRINEVEAELKGRHKDKLPLDEFKAENPEYKLVELANLTERTVSKQRKIKSGLIKHDAPREQVKAVEDRITKLMAGFNGRVKELKQMPQAAH